MQAAAKTARWRYATEVFCLVPAAPVLQWQFGLPPVWVPVYPFSRKGPVTFK